LLSQEAFKIHRGFISAEESSLIVDWMDSLNHTGSESNYHLSELSKDLKGKSCIFDISNTEKTNYITKFQSISDVSREELPDFIHDILNRISEKLGLPKNHTFLQAVDMRKGGKINPHYDASVEGHINYKCNISVLSEDYDFHVGEDSYPIEERDLYCFEASLYKHWTDEFNSRRVFLSFGFIVPYATTGRDSNDVRVRLSKRIEKYFQSIKK
jgi:hypothetical protein